MSLSQTRAASPYAIAFSIEDLILVRSWSEQRDLCLSIVTDQVLDGAEFEELLIISPRNRDRRTLTLWRSHNTVFAQTPHSRPRAFHTVKDLLESLRPAPKPRAGWLRMLGFAS